jgi:hypothetical protein
MDDKTLANILRNKLVILLRGALPQRVEGQASSSGDFLLNALRAVSDLVASRRAIDSGFESDQEMKEKSLTISMFESSRAGYAKKDNDLRPNGNLLRRLAPYPQRYPHNSRQEAGCYDAARRPLKTSRTVKRQLFAWINICVRTAAGRAIQLINVAYVLTRCEPAGLIGSIRKDQNILGHGTLTL